MPYLFLHCKKNENIQRVWPNLKIIGILLHCFDPYIASICVKFSLTLVPSQKMAKSLAPKFAASKDGK